MSDNIFNLREINKELNPKNNQQDCDHEFKYEDDWRAKISFDGGVLRIPIVCIKCGLQAEETWTEHMNTDKDTGGEI